MPLTTKIEHATTLDAWLDEHFASLSQRQRKRLMKAGAMRRAKTKLASLDAVLSEGDMLTVDLSVLDERSLEERAVLAAKQKDLVILAQSATWAAIRKPAGLGSTPGFYGDELCFSAFAAGLIGTEALSEGGLVHRLDHGTSGVSLFAKTPAALTDLLQQRDAGALARTYWAIVPGHVPDTLVLTAPIAHHPTHATRMVVVPDDEDVEHRGTPQSAETRVRKLGEAAGAALVEARIVGGRRHQIRVHLAHAGFPLFGDATYRGLRRDDFPPRLALHARAAAWRDPASQAPCTASAACGEHFWAFAPALRHLE